MRDLATIHNKLSPRCLSSAASPGAEGVLLLLVGLGFAEALPYESSLCEVARRSNDFACDPTHPQNVSLPFRQVRRDLCMGDHIFCSTEVWVKQ